MYRNHLWGRHLHKGNSRLPKKAATVLVRVPADVYNPFYPGIDDHLGAGNAWLVGYVDHAACRAYTVKRGLDDGVLFGVERAHAVAVNDQMADVIAVRQAGWRAIVAGSQNASVADDCRANMGAITGAARGHGECNLEKVLIP